MYVYIVKPGDTVQSISAKFSGGWEEFLATNLHVEFGGLKIGQTVYIPKHWIEKNNGIGVGIGIDDVINILTGIPWTGGDVKLPTEGMYCNPSNGLPCASGLECDQYICTVPGQIPTPGSDYNVPSDNNFLSKEGEWCDWYYAKFCDSGLECDSSTGVCVQSGTAIAGEQDCINRGGEWDSDLCYLPDQPVAVNEDLPGTITEEDCNNQGGQWQADNQYCYFPENPTTGVNQDYTDSSAQLNNTGNVQSEATGAVNDTPTKNESLLWWILGGVVTVLVGGTTIYVLSKQNKSVSSNNESVSKL